MRAAAISQLVIEFLIAEPHLYSYAGHYTSGAENVISETNGHSHSMDATLYRVVELGPNLTGTVIYFFDWFFSDASTQHSGLLEPGRYYLQAHSNVRLDTSGTRGTAGFTVNLALAPTPVPEPATLVLVALGAAVGIGRARLLRARHAGNADDARLATCCTAPKVRCV